MKTSVHFILITFLTVSFIGCSTPASTSDTRPSVETKQPSKTRSTETTLPANDDQTVLDELRKAGSDLSKPHEFDFYFYFADENVAQRAATRIRASGLKVDVRRRALGKDWLCLAKKTMLPKLSDIEDITLEFERLATEFGGEFDGWEAAVVR